MTVKQYASKMRVTEKCIRHCCAKGLLISKKAEGKWDIQEIPFCETSKPDEVAKILNVSVRFVEKLCKSGKLSAKKLGRLWRISKQSAEELMIKKIEKQNREDLCQP